MDGLLEIIISKMRPIPLKGKGFVLDFLTPHAGMRTAAVAGQYAMTLDLSNAIHRQIFMGCFARNMTRWTKALLPPGGIFLDVGAHVGYFSLVAAKQVGPSGQVYAVEPNPAPFTALQRHLVANRISHVNVYMLGLAEVEGSTRLHVPDVTVHRDYNATFLPRAGWEPIDVPIQRLDDCLNAWNVSRIDLMKIDVEGSEPRVLAGGAARLAGGVVRHVMIEINGPRLVEADSSPALLVQKLTSLGFAPADLSHGRALPASIDSLDLDPTHESDRLFVHHAALS
jgi:FkbM family methyltransferase